MTSRPADLSTAPLPGPHGGDGARLAAALGVDPSAVLDLSASMNPCAPDVAALAARRLDALHRYPDAAEAATATATALGVDTDRVLLTNGGSEAIALVAEDAFEGDVHDPSSPSTGATWQLWAWEAGAGGRTRTTPPASWPPPTTKPRSGTRRSGRWPPGRGRGATPIAGATVLGSLTKLFACPGLRVGYALAPDAATADRLRRRQPLWSVNGLACALVPELLELADLPAWCATIRTLQRDLVAVLRSAGYCAKAPAGPWVLVSPAEDLRDRLARSGILVRDCASFGLPSTVRMGVPGPAGLERVSAAVR